MNKVILIGGELATGKTTLAKSLSEKTGIPYFYKDVLKEVLADNIGFANREENKKLSKGVFGVLMEISKQFISSKKDLILESNFKQEEVDQLEKLFTSANYEIISIVLSGNNEILYERYLNRFEKENRHPAHSNFTSKKEFDEYNFELLKVKYPGKVLSFVTDNFVDVNSLLYL